MNSTNKKEIELMKMQIKKLQSENLEMSEKLARKSQNGRKNKIDKIVSDIESELLDIVGNRVKSENFSNYECEKIGIVAKRLSNKWIQDFKEKNLKILKESERSQENQENQKPTKT